MSNKKFVKVIVEFSEEGIITPKIIVWEDDNGRQEIEIDKVVDRRLAPSLRAGGLGMRYECKINGYTKYLFCEENKWFVELK